MDESRNAGSQEILRGRIVEFDEHRGLGQVHSSMGEEFLFHCIEIADGSRKVDIGTEVEFEIRLKFSRWEAFSLRPVARGSDQP